MTTSPQTPNDTAKHGDSWTHTWIPTLFGSAPSRLFKPPPPKPKPFDHIYGLNMESISQHGTTTYTDP
ncbi:hypothetical protein B0T20DRAFT_325081, partial [Sordaria brevicollis]